MLIDFGQKLIRLIGLCDDYNLFGSVGIQDGSFRKDTVSGILDLRQQTSLILMEWGMDGVGIKKNTPFSDY